MLRGIGGSIPVTLVHCASNYPSDSARAPDLAGLGGALRLNVEAPAELTARLLPLMAPGSSVLFVGSTLSEKALETRAHLLLIVPDRAYCAPPRFLPAVRDVCVVVGARPLLGAKGTNARPSSNMAGCMLPRLAASLPHLVALQPA